MNTNESEIYEVNSLKKMIDLNGDSRNFYIKLRVESEGHAPFYALIAPEKALDDITSYNYVEKGVFEAELSNNDNVFQTYRLVLKADQPIKCTVSKMKQEIPVRIDPKNEEPPSSGIDPRIYWAIGIAIVCVAGYFLFRSYSASPDSPARASVSFAAEPTKNGNLFERLNKLI